MIEFTVTKGILILTKNHTQKWIYSYLKWINISKRNEMKRNYYYYYYYYYIQNILIRYLIILHIRYFYFNLI